MAAWGPEALSSSAVWVADDTGLSNGGTTSSWLDRSGTRSMAQATSSKQAVMNTAGVGGQPAFDFDAVDDIFRFAGTIHTNTTGHVFLIMRIDTLGAKAPWATSDEASDIESLFGSLSTISGGAANKLEVNARDNATQNRVSSSTTTLATATDYLLEWASDGSSYTMRVNDVLQSKTVPVGSDNGLWFSGIPGRDNVTLGGWKRNSGEVLLCDCKIATAVFTAVTMSAAERNSLYGWTIAKYGIALPFAGTAAPLIAFRR